MSVIWFYNLTGQGTIMQTEPFSRLEPFISHLFLFNLSETFFLQNRLFSQLSFSWKDWTEKTFFSKTQVFQKMWPTKSKETDFYTDFWKWVSGDIAVDFTSKKHQSFLKLKVILRLAAKWSSNDANDLIICLLFKIVCKTFKYAILKWIIIFQFLKMP